MQQHPELNSVKLILVDVYDTILDMSDIEKRINGLLDSKRAYTIWFELLMQYTFVENYTREFHDFPSIAGATLEMTARILNEKINAENIKGILDLMKHLPIKEHAQKGLSELNNYGYRIAALTNSSQEIVGDRMKLSGLISYFEEVLSAEKIKKYKPAIEVYNWAMNKLGVQNNEVLFVASQAWDIAGAQNAGMKTAYIKKEGQMLYPLAPAPDITCLHLKDLYDQLIPFTSSTVENNAI